MAKFNPTITAYLVPCITEGYDNCYWVSILLKVEHISGTHALPDIYTLALGLYQAKHQCPWYHEPQ